MKAKVRKAGKDARGQSPGPRSEVAGEMGEEAVRGEFGRVAAGTGLAEADVRRCLFHSNAYRAQAGAACGEEEEAAIDEIMSGRRTVEDLFEETFALNRAAAERFEEIKIAAGTPMDPPAFGQGGENPVDGEVKYVTEKTGLAADDVRRCLVESALCRIDHDLAELERKVGLVRH